MIERSKNTAMSGDEKEVRQKHVFSFPPQDGEEAMSVEADTSEEAGKIYQEKIKANKA